MIFNNKTKNCHVKLTFARKIVMLNDRLQGNIKIYAIARLNKSTKMKGKNTHTK